MAPERVIYWGLRTELRVVIPLTINIQLGDVWAAMTGGDDGLPPQTGGLRKLPFFDRVAGKADGER